MNTIKLCTTLICNLYISTTFSQWTGGNPEVLPSGQSAGIGTSNPQAPLHVVGDGVANAQGWNKAIILDKNAALIWKGSTNSYFMAHPSNNPVGDFYQGFSAGINLNAVVTYTGKVFASNTPPAGIPKGSTQFFKNVLVNDIGDTANHRLGVNLLVPKRSIDVTNKSSVQNTPQFRITHTPHTNPNRGIWTDFQTTNTGNLYINPRRFVNNQSEQRNVGIAASNPRRRLEVADTINPQLRLSARTNPITQLTYTDFLTTSVHNNFGAGNMLINPRRNAGLQNGAVIINMLDSTTALYTGLSLYVNGQQNLRHAVEGDTNHVKVLVWDSLNNGRIKWRHADSLADKDWLRIIDNGIPKKC